jgi:hypothetical protein
MSISVLKNSRVSNPAIFSKNFASGSIPSISKNYLTQFNLHSLRKRRNRVVLLTILLIVTMFFAFFIDYIMGNS